MSNAFDTAFLLRFRARLKESLEACDRVLLDGNCTSFDGYKHRVGRREGLMHAVEIATEVETELSAPPEKRKA